MRKEKKKKTRDPPGGVVGSFGLCFLLFSSFRKQETDLSILIVEDGEREPVRSLPLSFIRMKPASAFFFTKSLIFFVIKKEGNDRRR